MSGYDVAIIGAGPAGIMAAITASQNGKRVALIEKNAQIGRKLLATGNGRCNLTNMHVGVDRYHGADPEFIQTVLKSFNQCATMDFFRNLGLVLKEEDNGRIFPRTNQASSVVEVLRQRLARNRVHVLLGNPVSNVEKRGVWAITLESGAELQADRLIIATGGRAAHSMGSTGDGLHWARKLGHTLTPTYAALVPVETVETWPKEAQGVKVEAGVRATGDGKRISESAGDVLFTTYGVSGPAIMALAGSIAPLLGSSRVQLHIDLFPEMTEEQLGGVTAEILHNGDRKTVRDALVGLLPNSMIPVIARLAECHDTKRVSEVTKAKRLDMIRALKDLTLTVSKLRPFKEAQVTAGGVDTREIDPRNMESKLVKGLYFAGEVVDVYGDSGGFNLQWAWSSGHVAGMAAWARM